MPFRKVAAIEALSRRCRGPIWLARSCVPSVLKAFSPSVYFHMCAAEWRMLLNTRCRCQRYQLCQEVRCRRQYRGRESDQTLLVANEDEIVLEVVL